MDKKTLVIVAASLLVVGGAYYGINRWRQQSLANQLLRQAYGLNTGLLGKFSGSGNVQEQIAKELVAQQAREEARQKVDEAKEAAKTPEDKYNETEEMPTYDATSARLVAEAKNIIQTVFGKAKLTSISSNVMGVGAAGYSFMEFEVPRLATGADLSAFIKAVTDKGLPVLQSGIADKTASITAGNNETATYSFGFEVGKQSVGVNIIQMTQ